MGRLQEKKVVILVGTQKPKILTSILLKIVVDVSSKNFALPRLENKKSLVRVFEINEEMYLFKQEARDNLLSIKGIEMRVNRSSQVEGTFGIIKQDMAYERVRRRSFEKVSAEIMLVSLGYVFRKAFGLLSGKGSIDYGAAPKDLMPDKIPELNIEKILHKKKRRKDKNETLRKPTREKEKIYKAFLNNLVGTEELI